MSTDTPGASPGTNPPYDFLFFIGRFQPLHLGHQAIIDQALEQAKHVVILVGSANMPRSIQNPWTFDDRELMIRTAFPEVTPDRLIIRPLHDIKYNDEAWAAQVQNTVTDTVLDYGNKHGFRNHGLADFRVGLIGFEKDHSSYYLKMFPQWENFQVRESWGTVSSTQIRQNYFQKAPILPHDLCSQAVIDYMKHFMLFKDFRHVLDEAEAIRTIRAKWAHAPYEPHFVTADAVVTQSGHILLVTRGEHPGKGLLALPGGHIVPSDGGSFDNCIKELWEEAGPSDGRSTRGRPMPKGRLRGFYTGHERRFDAPGRDPRGFYLTTAFRFVFPDGELWPVKGGDDASHAAWYPIGSLDPTKMFADHYFIIQQMLGEGGGTR